MNSLITSQHNNQHHVELLGLNTRIELVQREVVQLGAHRFVIQNSTNRIKCMNKKMAVLTSKVRITIKTIECIVIVVRKDEALGGIIKSPKIVK